MTWRKKTSSETSHSEHIKEGWCLSPLGIACPIKVSVFSTIASHAAIMQGCTLLESLQSTRDGSTTKVNTSMFVIQEPYTLDMKITSLLEGEHTLLWGAITMH